MNQTRNASDLIKAASDFVGIAGIVAPDAVEAAFSEGDSIRGNDANMKASQLGNDLPTKQQLRDANTSAAFSFGGINPIWLVAGGLAALVLLRR